MRRIVLTTSDIQKNHGSGVYKSTGRLERAIAEGYEVFIASSRTKLVETDDWWAKLVPADHIFLADELENDLADYLSSSWKKCLAALGITWPTEGELKPAFAERLSAEWAAKPGTWPDVQYWLPRKGIDTKYSFPK
jgi:hypothetical protein